MPNPRQTYALQQAKDARSHTISHFRVPHTPACLTPLRTSRPCVRHSHQVHDGPCVTHACKSVGELAESQGDLVGKSLCDAVSAHFLPSRTWDEQEELLAEGGPVSVCGRGECSCGG
eukprot:353869-Chlamydomonas_euryale.AAC.2